VFQVCLALSEVLANVTKAQLTTFLRVFIPAGKSSSLSNIPRRGCVFFRADDFCLVRKAVCDKLPEVREAAAKAFDTLYALTSLSSLWSLLRLINVGGYWDTFDRST
jgi:hypothetical protein